MALSYALTIVARQKEFLSITGASFDTVLDRLIDSATDWIENYCDRRFQETAYTQELLTGRDTGELVLRNFPISSSETFLLERRDTVTNENNWSTIESETYFVDFTPGIIRLITSDRSRFHRSDTFISVPNHYRVTYTAGFNFDNAASFLSTVGAADLEYACWKLVGAAFSQRKTSGNIASEKIGDYSVTFTKETMMDDELQEILSRYRRHPG